MNQGCLLAHQEGQTASFANYGKQRCLSLFASDNLFSIAVPSTETLRSNECLAWQQFKRGFKKTMEIRGVAMGSQPLRAVFALDLSDKRTAKTQECCGFFKSNLNAALVTYCAPTRIWRVLSWQAFYLQILRGPIAFEIDASETARQNQGRRYANLLERS